MDLSFGVGKAGNSLPHSWTQTVGCTSVLAGVNRLIILFWGRQKFRQCCGRGRFVVWFFHPQKFTEGANVGKMHLFWSTGVQVPATSRGLGPGCGHRWGNPEKLESCRARRHCYRVTAGLALERTRALGLNSWAAHGHLAVVSPGFWFSLL